MDFVIVLFVYIRFKKQLSDQAEVIKNVKEQNTDLQEKLDQLTRQIEEKSQVTQQQQTKHNKDLDSKVEILNHQFNELIDQLKGQKQLFMNHQKEENEKQSKDMKEEIQKHALQQKQQFKEIVTLTKICEFITTFDMFGCFRLLFFKSFR